MMFRVGIEVESSRAGDIKCWSSGQFLVDHAVINSYDYFGMWMIEDGIVG